MNAELRELYQELILDHGKHPRNFRQIEGTEMHAEGYNPLCGDRCEVYATSDDDAVTDAAFQGKGCAISQASASLMTQTVKGKSRAEIDAIYQSFHRMVMDEATPAELDKLGKLAVLSGVKEFPSRVKCATLPWHTLMAALNKKSDPVSTE